MLLTLYQKVRVEVFVCCDQNWFQSECVFSNITKVERTKEDVATFIACASELGACTLDNNVIVASTHNIYA